MPAHKASPVERSAKQEHERKDLVRAYLTPRKPAERARIILAAATGAGRAETAVQLAISHKSAIGRPDHSLKPE